MSLPSRARRRRRAVQAAVAGLEETGQSLLEVVDHVLNQGVVVTGDVVLGIANVDLVYLRVSALLCAADRVLPPRER
ncbi:MAG TPA: gas vesicle protein [Vicinamibacteria bacterium]|nr:gas vesicle protein [Vicinamibacteria bacterium]